MKLRYSALLIVLLLSAVAHAAPPTATNVNVTGTAEEGQTLTGAYDYFDADSDEEGVSTFRWLRDGGEIGGATGTSYLLQAADVGSTITFEVTPVAATETAPNELIGSPVESAPTATIVAANTAPVANNVAISGTEEVGQTLTGSYDYFDADGDTESGTTFRWLRGANPIGGATGTSYTLVGVDEGNTIRFEVTPRAGSGVQNGVPTLSAPTGLIGPANSAPVANNVSISGTTEIGQTLTGSYNYFDADGDAEGVSTFRWLRDGGAIGGATGTTYTLVGADDGAMISFEVTPVAQTGVSPGTPVSSSAVGPVTPTNTAPVANNVAISGTEEVGQTLTGSYNYFDADGDTESGTTFRWLRGATPSGGATGTSYTLVGADEGNTIRFEVTPRAGSGVQNGVPTLSSPTGVIGAANSAPVANNVAISGTEEVGQQGFQPESVSVG
jgi:hypothetical protein